MTSKQNLVERSVSGLHNFLVNKLMQYMSPSGPVLDIGCGSGAWLHRLAQLDFHDLVGMDSNVTQVQTGAATFIQYDLEHCGAWPVPHKEYQLITAIEVIEYLSNIGHLLSQAQKLLKPDGLLLITTPNIHSLNCRLRFLLTGELKQFGRIGDPTHLFPVILGTLPRVLSRWDLELRAMWSYPDDGRILTSRSFVSHVTRFLRIFLPESSPGDILCMLIQKARG